jgi:hypothetical protein
VRIQKSNWYGLDHEAVKKHFEGEPIFVNDFCVNDEYPPSAVYYCANPNLEKGHKNYVLLTKSGGQMYVRGMTPEEMEKWRYQDALHCLSCDEVIYSVNRHDFHPCSCGKVKIDGGRDYTKICFDPDAKFKHVTLDLLTDTISDTKPE